MKKASIPRNTALTLAALALFCISLLLNWSSFFPTLSEINPWDEAGYVKSGQEMLRGDMPNFAGSPLTAVFYAVLNVIFGNSPYWLIYSVASGRLIAYTLIWLSAFYISKRLHLYAYPLIMLCMLLAAPFFIKMLRFPSDPIFLAFAGLALAEMIDYIQSYQFRRLVMAGLLITLAAAARNDGLIIFLVALVWLFVFVVVKKINGRAIL
ncbi:MAG: hypothetical protein JW704_10015, partial [Anaerolineaceae bacterium]|nr:hypothetical protein [Anaerolineaceae bacterium]